ncbi:MAG TPA: transporter [Fimbriiglobus sp.]|jgi:hypothetical protein
MTRASLLAAIALAAPFAGGCDSFRQSAQFAAAMPDDVVTPAEPVAGDKDKKDNGPPKTLFKWEVGGEEPQKPDEPKPDKITTDRPDFTESSTTVGLGRIQLETGYTYTRDRADGGLFQSHTYPEALLRLGLFAEWFELRLGQTVLTEQNQSAAGVATKRTGLTDFNFAGVFALTEQKGILPESAVLVGGSVPTGSSGFTDNRFLPTASYLFSWELTKKWDLGGSSVVSKAVEDDGHGYYVFAESLTTGYEWTDKIGNYLEVFALLPSAANGPEIKPQYYFNGGVTYLFTPLCQFDARAGVGLNKAAADFFCGAGISVKY